jgi:membrane associated rhomboid family serine protease
MYYGKHSFSINFRENGTLFRLIYVNVAVFAVIHLLHLVFWLMLAGNSSDGWVMNWLAVPAKLEFLITRPWTIITYMFLHVDFWHIFGNMLWLFFLGQIFEEFLGERKLWTVYLAGGIAGALLYILFFNFFPVFREVMPISRALGASASVMAIVIGIATYAPNFSIRLLFLGNIPLKYIGIFWFVVDLLGISNSNSGGHIAHIGGAALGFFFARQWKKGKDITAWAGYGADVVKSLFSFKPKSKLKVKYRKSAESKDEFNSRKQEKQERLDAILDKISRSGYDSLSKEEKDELFRASKQN